MTDRARAVRWTAGLLLALGAALTARCVASGIWTTTLAALGLGIGALALLRGRTWGALFTLALGVSFAGATALSMTNAPVLFLTIAVAASVPAVLLARPMWRFDRAATATALIGAIVWGGVSAALVYASADALIALGRAEAEWDLAHGRAAMRFCAEPESDGVYERRLEQALGISSEHVACGASAIADNWNAGYDDAVREHVEARCGEGALDALLWLAPTCR